MFAIVSMASVVDTVVAFDEDEDDVVAAAS